MARLTRTAMSLESALLERFDAWMARHGYTNRSEAMRDLIRAALVEQEWADPRAPVVAVLSVIYDHAAHGLAQVLADMQHHRFRTVLCSQHVHLDRHLCLEVVLLRGRAGQLRHVADRIIATRGVRAGKLTLMSTKV
ncbi:MAG: nickel-responsive transcriptional regulator NikR [Phycisphaerae bacterium]|nr:nickel-responsive transcriptional regulator NikR [Phycisphaerae bacterium]